MNLFLRIFFHFLYHQFAFAYDFVAAVVSFGQWKNWILETVPFIEGKRILEIGHGPGHLQRVLLDRGLIAVAMDESTSMARLAKRNTDGSARLVRGLAQQLPFASESFDTVIATFPTEYFADPFTLLVVKRCLSDGGRFVVLPVAMPKNRFLSWLFQITNQSPSESLMVFQERLKEPFVESGFDAETHVLEKDSGTLIVIVAMKHQSI